MNKRKKLADCEGGPTLCLSGRDLLSSPIPWMGLISKRTFFSFFFLQWSSNTRRQMAAELGSDPDLFNYVLDQTNLFRLV